MEISIRKHKKANSLFFEKNNIKNMIFHNKPKPTTKILAT